MTIPQHVNSTPDRLVDLTFTPWKSNIIAGNKAVEQGDLNAAKDKYLAAWAISVNLLNQLTCGELSSQTLSTIEHCCPAVVASAHSLSNCYLALGKATKACRTLTSVNSIMMKLHHHSCVDISDIAQHHHYKTRQELIHFAAHHPHFPELITEINSNISA
jgi:hypothetical protein